MLEIVLGLSILNLIVGVVFGIISVKQRTTQIELKKRQMKLRRQLAIK